MILESHTIHAIENKYLDTVLELSEFSLLRDYKPHF